jgi:hypothetical protein
VSPLVTVIWSGEKKKLDMTTSATGSSEGEADPEDGGDVDAAGDEVVAAGDEVSSDAHAAVSATSITTITSTPRARICPSSGSASFAVRRVYASGPRGGAAGGVPHGRYDGGRDDPP